MNKKKLIAQNEELYNMLKANEANLASMKKRIDELMIMLGAKDFEINELKAKAEELEQENASLKNLSASYVIATPVPTASVESLEVAENIEQNEETEEKIKIEMAETVEEKAEEKSESAVKHIKVESIEDEISKYAAKSISNISLKAAILSNTLALSQNPNAKDLLTLTLGRSEVFKQKVFEVTKSAISLDTAKASINLLEAETIEYFEQLKAQL